MAWQIGDVYQAKTGEILEVGEFTAKEFQLKVRDPRTLELTDKALYGDIKILDNFAEASGFKKIDLKTFVPVGLMPEGRKDG